MKTIVTQPSVRSHTLRDAKSIVGFHIAISNENLILIVLPSSRNVAPIHFVDTNMFLCVDREIEPLYRGTRFIQENNMSIELKEGNL